MALYHGSIAAYLNTGLQVIDGSLKVGNFVVLVGTIMKFDGQISNVFKDINTLFGSYIATVRLSALLNANTRRRDLFKGQERRTRLLKAHSEMDDGHDDELIFVAPGTKVQHTSYQKTAEDEGGVPTNFHIELPSEGIKIHQGQILMLHAAENSSGKQTFLKALARIILPSEGFISYPGKLRVRFLPAEPQIFNSTVFANLKFGNMHAHRAEDMQELCRMIGLSPYLWEEVTKVEKAPTTPQEKLRVSADEEANYEKGRKMEDLDAGWGNTLVGVNGNKLSLSDRIRVGIIRALLSNVDFLLLYNTLDALGYDNAISIINVLQVFVEQRGVPCLSFDMSKPHSLRKRKTVIMSTKNPQLQGAVDNALQL